MIKQLFKWKIREEAFALSCLDTTIHACWLMATAITGIWRASRLRAKNAPRWFTVRFHRCYVTDKKVWNKLLLLGQSVDDQFSATVAKGQEAQWVHLTEWGRNSSLVQVHFVLLGAQPIRPVGRSFLFPSPFCYRFTCCHAEYKRCQCWSVAWEMPLLKL